MRKIRFVLSRNHPNQQGWPTHGHFTLYDDAGSPEGSSPILFSVERGIQLLQGRDGPIASEEEMGRMQHDMSMLGLPRLLTRYDRLIQTYGLNETTAQLIAHFSGAATPQADSGPARFEKCSNGARCHSPNCSRYGAHGQFWVENMNVMFHDLAFSSAQALASLAAGIKNGIFSPQNEARLTREIGAAQLVHGSNIMRADKVAHREDAMLFLDVIFRIHVPTQSARFEQCQCGSHLHLYAFDDLRVGLGSATMYDGLSLLRTAIEEGLVDPGEQRSLMNQLNTLDLQPGGSDTSLHEIISWIQDLTDEEALSLVLGLVGST